MQAITAKCGQCEARRTISKRAAGYRDCTTKRNSVVCTYNCVRARVCVVIYTNTTTSITLSESVFLALRIQHVMCKRHIVICGVPGSAIFLHIISKRHNFLKKLLNTKCVVWYSLQLLSETFLNLRGTEWDMIKNVYWSSCKVPLIPLRCWWILNFPDRFPKKNWNIRFHENPPSGSRVVTCGRTDTLIWRS